MSVLPILIDTRKQYKILVGESDRFDYPCMFLKGNGYNGFNGGYSNNNYNSDNNSFNNYNAASDSSYSGNTDNYSSDSSYADNVFNNANNDSSSYGSSASEEPGNSYTGSVNNAPYGSPFDNDKSDN